MCRADDWKTMPEDMRGLLKRSAGGFTLVEMMVTMLILTLTATLMATGIPVAIDTYKKIVKFSNAELALSTTIEVLRSELGLATDVIVDGEKIYYLNSKTGYWCSIANPDDFSYRGLVKQVYIGTPGASDNVEGLTPYTVDDGSGGSKNFVEPLLTNEAITAELIVRFDGSKINRPNAGEVDVVLYAQEYANGITGNRLAAIGEGEGYGESGYRILTRLAS